MNNNKPVIKSYDFSPFGNEECRHDKKGQDWPVVYFINNNDELYVGETSNFYSRFKQHRDNPERKRLKTISVVYDDEFNKSAILDIEQSLIQYFGADNKYKLQNRNAGQSPKHNYYQRQRYLQKVDIIWNLLTKKGMTKNSIEDLRNTDLFKFSPYTSLTPEQYTVCNDIIDNIINTLNTGEKATSIIEGNVGTGKTVVLINLIHRIVNAPTLNVDSYEDSEEDNDYIKRMISLKDSIVSFEKKENRKLRIAFVVPMGKIRESIKRVFSSTKSGLKANLVVGPMDISKEYFDIVFVDEAHRLPRYKNYLNKKAYLDACKRMNLNQDIHSSLDMIINNSSYRVLVYDGDQRVKETDIPPEQFAETVSKTTVFNHGLDTQMRCRGGQPFIYYISGILSSDKDLEYKEILDYDFRLYDNVESMICDIESKKELYNGLCKVVAGYSWEWISKNTKSYEEAVKKGLEDIRIDNYKYVWNLNNKEYIFRETNAKEIGCIHTTQGFDLNYVGVIFGPEIDYDYSSCKITIDLSKYYDTGAMKGATEENKKTYILNGYKTMMGRGIHGCYVYACNKNLREYFSKFIPESHRSST